MEIENLKLDALAHLARLSHGRKIKNTPLRPFNKNKIVLPSLNEEVNKEGEKKEEEKKEEENKVDERKQAVLDKVAAKIRSHSAKNVKKEQVQRVQKSIVYLHILKEKAEYQSE